MRTVSIRVSEETHQRLRELAHREARPISTVADEAVRAYEKGRRWRAAEEAMARLRQDPSTWEDYQAEAALWDATSADGLADLPYEQQG